MNIRKKVIYKEDAAVEELIEALESVQAVKNKLYEREVQIRESRFSDPVRKSARIKLFMEKTAE